ncbi:hypothetical protein [Flavobacterium succinicans]|nr:hypothetical protein [Flavobacterium succinicans]
MHISKNKHTNKNSSIALLFLFVFFHFLLYSAFSAIPVFSSSKLEKENLVQISTKSDHSKYSKITFPSSDMEEDFEYNEIEIDPFLNASTGLIALNSLNKKIIAIHSKFLNNYFYKKSSLFLLFCNLKYHLG